MPRLRLLPLLAPLAIACAPSAAPPPPTPLGLCDVSVLVPLEVAASWLPTTAAGARGPLLPADAFAKIPTFPVRTADTLLADRLRVVGVRVDPCFRPLHGEGASGPCAPQVRLVAQPIAADGTARDAALHLFYALDEARFATVLEGLRALAGGAASEGPLRVSPRLSEEGVEGPYATALRALLLEHLGEENLIRETFFLRAPPTQETWFFGGFARGAAGWDALPVVGVPSGIQRVIRPATTAGYRYDVTPLGGDPEDGTSLYAHDGAAGGATAAQQAAYASFLRVENPRRYSPDDLPCAGCHLGTVITAHAEAKLGLSRATSPMDASGSGDAYRPRRDGSLTTKVAETLSSLRAFGWFERAPMISLRTIAETDAVLDDLEGR